MSDRRARLLFAWIAAANAAPGIAALAYWLATGRVDW